MVIGLASARKQLQSRLIYLCRQNFPYCSALVLLAGVACSLNAQFPFGPKRGTPKPAAPKPAAPKPMRKASELISRQDPVKINNSLLKQISPDSVRVAISLPRQRAYLMMGDANRDRQPDLIRQARAQHAHGPFLRHGKGCGSPFQHLWRLCRQLGSCCPRRHQRQNRFRPQRNTLCGRADEVVYAANGRRRWNACRDFARISRIAWLYPNAARRSEAILR